MLGKRVVEVLVTLPAVIFQFRHGIMDKTVGAIVNVVL